MERPIAAKSWRDAQVPPALKVVNLVYILQKGGLNVRVFES